MKTKLLLLIILLPFILKAQDTEVTVSMGAGYANNVYYKLATQTENTYPSVSWDIAFFRDSNYDMNIRVNHQNISKVYVASTNIAEWNSIVLTNEANWTAYYNSATNWAEGAFYQPKVESNAFDYGWGLYNSANHHVVGNRIFVLKLANNDYYKVLIQDFYGGYTFKYAKWNTTSSSWDADQNVSLPNTQNTDRFFNYYSLQNNQGVVAEPAKTDWDFVFMKYYIWYNNTQWYLMTGALHHSAITVAENVEVGTDIGDTSNLSYSADINTIGDDWKTFAGTSYTINSDKKYYIKYANNTIYRLYFTGFVGSSNGNITFKFRDVTSELGYDDISENLKFGIAPNPTENKQINLVYEIKNEMNNSAEIIISDMVGTNVYTGSLSNNAGFFNQSIDLSNLNSGTYLVNVISGNSNKTFKVLLQ